MQLMAECTKNKHLKKVLEWANQSWIDSINNWVDRPLQDYRYRKVIVEPAIKDVFDAIPLDSESLIVEFGCGDGSHSIFLRQLLDKKGLTRTKILGIDLLEDLVKMAVQNSTGYKNIEYISADVTDPSINEVIHSKVGKPDVIVAMFLLQDTPDIEGVLGAVYSSLRTGGHFFAVFVHPEFAESLSQKGYIKIRSIDKSQTEYISENGIVQWRFIGEYPIVRDDGPPFYLPYFHRTLNDYFNAFEKSGLSIKKVRPLRPALEIIPELEKKEVLPFCWSKMNVYWPMILREPSSVLIHATKRI